MRKHVTGKSSWRRRSSICFTASVIIATAQLLGSSSASATPKPDTLGLSVKTIEVSAESIRSFEKLGSGKARYGKLEWIGGLRLRSDDPLYGGWSGIALDGDGKSFVAVSDAGLWMRGQLDYRDGRPSGISGARVGALKALDGSILKRDRDRDAEAVVLLSGSIERGRLLIAFEQNHRIGHFDIGPDGVSAPRSYIRPDRSRGRMNALKGFEAIQVVRGGRYKGSVVAFAERKHDSEGRHTGWLWTGGKAHAFSLTDIGGFDITDAAALPDGDLLVLERRFRWTEGVKMRIRRIAARELAPAAAISGEVLLEATMAQEIDNMEGIAVHQDDAGATVVTLISDDNFNRGLQRNLLLQFRLHEETEKAAER